MRSRFYTILLLGLFITSCGSEAWQDVADPLRPPVLSETKKRDEAYKVYSAVLEKFGDQALVIHEQTGTGYFNSSIQFDDTGLTNDLIASYNVENQSSIVLEDQFSGPGEYILSKSDDEPYRANKKQADDTGRRPSGELRFSKVGFNQEMTRAIVSTSYLCGPLCGSGHFYFLAKTQSGWEIEWVKQTWIS